MTTIYYDHHFNQNEWFILFVLGSGLACICLLPQYFRLPFMIFYFILGSFYGFFFDHTISIKPFNYYDVNDSSRYEFFDFLSYLMYGPLGILFIYFYERLKVKGYGHIVYIAAWTMASLVMESLAIHLGVYHYKEYKIYYSAPIYVTTQSINLYLHQILKRRYGSKLFVALQARKTDSNTDG